MHEKTNSLAFKIVFGLISASLVLGGIGMSGLFSSADNSAVKVNGEAVSQQAFNTEKSRLQNTLQQQLGEKVWDIIDNNPQSFNNSVFNRLIENELLRQYAKNLKLDISPAQIRQEIVNTPFFHKDGKFDNAFYLQILRNNGLNADQYAASVYENMLLSQIREGIIESNFKLPIEETLLSKLLFQKRIIRLANYPIEKELLNQSASEEELKSYYEANKSQFINPEKLVVEYVVLEPKDIESQITITTEQVENYYQTNKANYITKGETQVSHIQLSDLDTAKAVLEELKNGKEFATLAKEKSLDSYSAKEGGNLGWVKSGIFPKLFEDTFNALKVGEISDVIKVDSFYHIIKVVDRKNETIIPLETVRSQIEGILRKELALVEYSKTAREMANIAFENSDNLESVAKVANLSIEKSKPFTRDNIPENLSDNRIVKVMFESPVKQNAKNSEAITLDNENNMKTMFLRVSEYQEQQPKTFEQAKQDIEETIKLEKAQKELTKKTEEIIDSLNQQKSVNITFSEPTTLIFIESQSTVPELSNTVFSMKKQDNNPTYHMLKNSNGDITIIQLDQIIDGETSEFNRIKNQTKLADGNELYNNLLNDLRLKAKIEFNQDFMKYINSKTP